MRAKKNKTKQNHYFGVGGLKGVVSKMVFLKLLTVQSLSRPILCPGIDLGSMNLHVFSLSKLKFRFLLFEKQSFWSIFNIWECVIFFFWWLCNPHLRSKSKFQVLNLKKLIETTYSESYKTFALVICSVSLWKFVAENYTEKCDALKFTLKNNIKDDSSENHTEIIPLLFRYA